MRSRTTVIVLCLAVFGAALAFLLLTGHTGLRLSADAEASAVPMAAVLASTAAGLLLVRLVPPRLPEAEPEPAEHRPALVRQAWGLAAIAVVFAAAGLALGGHWLLYSAGKLVLFIGVALLVVRIWRVPGLLRRARAGVPGRWRLLGPVPALAAWAYLLYYSPLAGAADLSGYAAYSREYLIAAALLTFVTASVTEEIFFRILLQTRLEALLGRWAGVLTASLLFAAMHLSRVADSPDAATLATIVVWNGGFGLLAGYLWSRHRSVWGVIALHGAVNSLTLLPLLAG
ncbi:CPBP family intramembrane glutamic endopeptidase [Allonocardiopsis opalescens]|uniref:Membrane protease YdiL (CAAX protease family) n=1 Tax=Allonocardiopsis opalescens TaxID=1144618 RepID=A0A2T0PZ36_9ACTN|nr:type II CAAX endopeptidase family protein [Allonocardiopsis opalescens]PRX96780.1 membrane protease YdiL (CAAX protease family) [Allonocardiopsis opalescens]